MPEALRRISASSAKPRKRPFEIAAVFPNNLMCYRQLQLGISAYAQLHPDWHLNTCDPDEDVEAFLHANPPDGLLLGQSVSAEAACQLAARYRHVVGACGQHWKAGVDLFPSVEVNDLAIGNVGADYFLRKGFRHFGFVGIHNCLWSGLRRNGFVNSVRQAGLDVAVFEQRRISFSISADDVPTNTAGSLIEWLQQQPKPFALMVRNDHRAQSVIRLCLREGINVPEEVAVLGVDDDDFCCSMSQPPLSSVTVPWQRMGLRAAEVLNASFMGSPLQPSEILLEPVGIAERQSTDTIAIADPEIRAAVRFIRDNAHRTISVDDVAEASLLTRRTLERRFRELLATSPLDEIKRAHLMRARTMLATTDFSLERIAMQCGFSSVEWFAKVFHGYFGDTPSNYRRHSRQQS